METFHQPPQNDVQPERAREFRRLPRKKFFEPRQQP
jgi:hypothetical protein